MKTTNNRILIVDDNPAIHDDFRKVLEPEEAGSVDAAAEALLFGAAETKIRQEFQIDSAYQGQEALAMIQKARQNAAAYALAFVDVRMPPGWDGVETIERLWQEDPDLQVVICTAYSDYSWEEITRKLGQSDSLVILKKPFDSIELQQLAHALTTKWNLTRQAKLQLAQLDTLVLQRTQELRTANERLKTEIAERSEAERALRRSEERFAKAFHASPIAMALLPFKEERVTDVNTAFLKMTQHSREEIIGRTARELQVWGDLVSEVKSRIERENTHSIREITCQVRAERFRGDNDIGEASS